MIKPVEEKTERARIIKILLTRWIAKQETTEKAALLLSKNPEIKLPKALTPKAAVPL